MRSDVMERWCVRECYGRVCWWWGDGWEMYRCGEGVVVYMYVCVRCVGRSDGFEKGENGGKVEEA